MCRPLLRYWLPVLLALPALALPALAVAGTAAAAAATSPPLAANTASYAYNDGSLPQRLDARMQEIEQQNQDVWNELDEEYAYITRERDDNASNIAKEIKEAEKLRDVTLARIEQEKATLEEARVSQNLADTDPKYQAGLQKISEDLTAANKTYDFALANLQQLYQLNGRRFDELMKIHDERDVLEDRRILAEKNLAAIELALQEDAANPNLSPIQKERFAYFQKALDHAKQDAESRYRSGSETLDEYRNLVIKRQSFLKENLADQGGVMQKLSAPNLSDSSRDQYLKEIAVLAYKKDVEEQTYQNDVRYLEEKFSFERLQNHELDSFATQRRDLDAVLADIKTQYKQESAELKSQMAAQSISEGDKADLQAKLAAITQAEKEQEGNYREAVRNLTERRNIVKKGLEERLAYLTERNDLRREMLAEPVTSTSYKKFRDRIVDLENRHIAQENAQREQLAKLIDLVPPAFAYSPWQRGDMDIRLVRLRDRVDGARKTLKNNLDGDIAKYNKQAQDLKLKLDSIDLADRQRKPLEEKLSDLKKQIGDVSYDYQRDLKGLAELQAAHEEKIMNRSQYISQRNEALKDLTLADYIGTDAARQIRKLQNLDADWRKRESEPKQNSMPFSGFFSIKDYELLLPDDLSAVRSTPVSSIPTKPTAPGRPAPERVPVPPRVPPAGGQNSYSGEGAGLLGAANPGLAQTR